jgi:uncharacterized membrane protein YgdD (TMEM256/DUF423 family)
VFLNIINGGGTTMEKYALIIGGLMFIGEGILKFFDFTFLGMNMPCGGSLIVVGFGLSLFAYKNIKNK